MKRVDASAPGKMLIGGEYAVLDGAPAIACAVQRRAFARWTERSEGPDIARSLECDTPRFPEAAAARFIAEQTLDVRIKGELALDVSALRTATTKLGVGSSAAAAAAAAAAVFASAGQDLNAPDVRLSLLRCALAGHEAVAPRGSGVDVAASVMGGTIRYVRKPFEVDPIQWPSGLVARVVWTGKSASTREFLDRIDALYHFDSAAYGAVMKALRERTAKFAGAFASDAPAVLRAVPELVEVLQSLGDMAGAPIVEEKLIQIAAIAARHGGAAKPSGAGGGDVALAFFLDEESAAAFAVESSAADLLVLDVELGGPGAQAEP